MTKENNKMQVDIDTLKKQNVNDLLSIKEIYKRIEELGEKITKIKYVDNTLVKKLKKEYENLNKIILDENIQVQLDNKIDDFNLKLTHDIETINSKLSNDIETINSQLDNTTNKIGNIKDIVIPYISKLIYKKDNKSWAESIQEYENEANNIYKSYGVKVRLKFPENEVIEINKTIYKKSGVDWLGSCTIKRNSSDNSTLYALVVANDQKDFIIDGLNFENLGHEIAHNIKGNWSIYSRNCCIHTYKCTDFSIINCNFTKYSEGIVNTGCQRYSILNNLLNSNVESKLIEQFLDDSYIDIAGAQTGDIMGWVLSQDANLYNEDFIISNNKCLSVGLRIGIEIMTQSATHARGIISNNIIKGLHHGIKLYKGTYGQLENAITNVKQCIISNNQISYCREIGIYIRANIGVLCENNFISYCGLYNTGDGTAYGGIVTRISAEITDVNSTLETGNFIVGNYVYNSGKTSGKSVEPHGIQVRNSNCSVKNNFIVQDSNYSNLIGDAIKCGMGDNISGVDVSNNKLINFNCGINIESSNSNYEESTITLANNIIQKCNEGIKGEMFGATSNLCIYSNMIRVNKLGISIRKSLNSIIENNKIIKSATGIRICSGCYTDNTNRTGATTIVRNNTFMSVTKPHEVIETAVGDVTFSGRCKYWGYDLVDGVITPSLG